MSNRHNLLKNLENNPYFNDQVFDCLPSILKKACGVFTDKRTRDLYLIAQISCLSSCFPKAYGLYDQDKVNFNVNTFIAAPAASGKGKMRYAKLALAKIADRFEEEIGKSPKKTEFTPRLFIPGNSSASAILSQLDANYECGIIFETEADTVIKTFANEWGDSSDIIRNSLQNESVSLLRRKDAECSEIKHPVLSVILSGTLDQYSNFLESVENGFFSRFAYYTFFVEPKWRDTRPDPKLPNLDLFFTDDIGGDLLNVYNAFFDKPISVTFSDENWDGFLEVYTPRLESNPQSEFYSQIVKRYGLMQFKIAGVLTILRAFEYEVLHTNDLVCSGQDYWIAEQIINTLYEHAIYTSQLFLEERVNIEPRVQKIFDQLPDKNDFDRQLFISCGQEVSSVAERQLYNHFTKYYSNGVISDNEEGRYKIAESYIED